MLADEHCAGQFWCQQARDGAGTIPALRRVTMTTIDTAWLEAFDKELLYLFAIDHSDAGMDEYLLGCYADLPPREAALAFGSDYDLERDDALWPRPGVAAES